MKRLLHHAGGALCGALCLLALQAHSADPGLVPAQPQPGPLLIPVAGIEARQLFDTFTQSRGEGRPHEAIDIARPGGRRSSPSMTAGS
jgi:hypothetical protein